MTINTGRLLEVQNRNANLSEDGLSPSYMKVLHYLWNGQFNAAADYAAQTIADDPETADTLQLYRAWVEALAQMEDQASLAELAQHLLDRGRDELELRQSYMALRGIIHIELDQAPAARLLLRALEGRVHNPYCLEFEQLCARRGFSEAILPITHSRGNIDDYFVWNTLLQDLAEGSHHDDLQQCLRHTGKVFPGAPSVDLFGMHLAFDHGQWQAAADHAENLTQAFPDHKDYPFHHAFALFRSKNLDAALRYLQAMPDASRSSDVDIMNLYGECLASRFERDQNDDDAHAAIRTLTAAARIMRRYGLEVDQTLSLIQSLEKQVGGSVVPEHAANHFRAPKNWMVVLSPRRCEEMVRAHDEQIETLHRPLGAQAEPGDVVLFVSRAAHTAKKSSAVRSEWRLLSMYRVTSRPHWHPLHRWHSALQLIDRPEHPIPIDAQELKSDIDIRGKRAALPRGHHARFAVYNLDDSAMDIMIAAVKRRSEGVDHEAERRGQALTQKKPV